MNVEVGPDWRGRSLLDLYDRALPQVFGYLMARCGDRAVAEDLTSETFLAAAGAGGDVALSVGWLIGVARHKLMDHWRRQDRHACQRLGEATAPQGAGQEPGDQDLEAAGDRWQRPDGPQ